MSLVLPGNVSVPDSNNVLTTDEETVLKRETRKTMKSPQPDRVDVQPQSKNISAGGSFDVDFDANFDFGTQVEIQLIGPDRNVIDSQSTGNTSGTFSFSNVSQDVERVRGIAKNGNGKRASDFTDVSLNVGDEVSHPDLPNVGDIGSEADQLLRSKSQIVEEKDGLVESADATRSIIDAQFNNIRDVELHVDLIVGIDFDPVLNSDINDASDPKVSKLFPQTHRDPAPKKIDSFNPSFSTTTTTINHYSSPNGSRTPGDQPEKQDLLDAKNAGSFPIDIYDETDETLVTYNSASDIDTRINEIDSIVNDFMDQGASDFLSLVDCAFNFTDLQVNRSFGFRFSANLNLNAELSLDAEVSVTGTAISASLCGIGI